MIRRLLISAALMTTISITGATFTAAPARADDPCGVETCEDDGDVVINPEDPGSPGDPGGGDDGDSGGTTGPATCTYQGKEIPCNGPNGVWNSGYGCYLQLAPGNMPVPPEATNPDGAWYHCIEPGNTTTVRTLWLDNPPQQLPSPAELAQEALERMNLEPVAIGIVPEDQPGRLGLVGMPVWMWVDNPTENTFGPMTESATAGSLTVTATARVESIEWNMGDGTTVTCTTDGTAYEDRFGDSDSPDCGHRYETTSWNQPGHRFAVTAVSHWVVEWAGGGQSGTIPINHTNGTQIRVGEMQVLTQKAADR